MATVPVSKAMLPARICRIKSGSRIVLPYRPPPMQVGWEDRYALCRVEVRILAARSKPTCWDDLWCAARMRYRRTRFPGTHVRFCHQEESDSVHFSSEKKMQIRRTIGIANTNRLSS